VTKSLQKSSHDSAITVLISAQKGKLASKTPFCTGELKVVQRTMESCDITRKPVIYQIIYASKVSVFNGTTDYFSKHLSFRNLSIL